ncbi:MAG: hypothetical protein PVS2B3_09800 [Steroidobacteraceae bacterium]
MKRPLFTPILIAAALLCQLPARADDIDVFTGAGTTATPNVLFIIDNTANWNLPFSNEMTALSAAFSSLPVNKDGSALFNIGIMFATESGNGNSNTSGAYVRAAIRPMTTTTRALYATMISNFDKLADKGDGGRSALNMVEAWQYFTGGAPYAGNGKIKTDYLGNVCVACGMKPAETLADDVVWALPGNALSSEYAASYNPPPNTSGCTKTFIIYISNGPNQENASVDATANSMLAAAGGNTTTIPISPAGSMSNPSDEWARFMHRSNLGVVTYTIDVNPPSTGQGPGWSALLKSMASVGGGKYQLVPAGAGGTADTSSISQAILADLSEIQAVNSVYAAVSLPASASAQGTYLNQVYIGMFRPDPSAAPRWYGNLKQYQMGFIGTALRLEDADQKSAINNQTGFITECARSFWSPTSVDTYWTFFPEGVCLPPAGMASNAYQNSNYPDGNIVEKGGEGYLLRQASPDARTMYTSSVGMGSGSSTLTTFSNSNNALTTSMTPNVLPPDKVSDVIDWERGRDVQDENQNANTTEMRPSAHGDVVHSRPVAINYGTAATPNVVVFYGANDGALRAVNGNQSTAAFGAAPGAELWSFVPPEFYPAITRLYDNKPLIAFPNQPTTGLIPAPLPKSYGMDGPMTAYHPDSSNTWLYAPMRRGGRALYAFDVSNPASPTMKWKVGCPNNFTAPGVVDDTGCSLNLAGMGQSWASAKVIKAAGYSGGGSPLIIMGGGYDTCEDSDPNTCTAATHGNKVYVLDDSNGSVPANFSTNRAVIADIAVVPDASGLAIYAYVADLGGNLYRITMGSNAVSSWTMTQIAALGCATPTPCTANRKFMFVPDVVLVNGIYTVLLGSGDREKPLRYDLLGSPPGSAYPTSVVNSVTNYFFAVEDNPMSATWLSSEQGHCGANLLCLNSLQPVTSNTPPSPTALAAKKGWYLSLNPYEQVVTSAITIYGTIYFSTHTPAVPPPPNASICASTLGTTRLYTVNFTAPATTSTLLPPVGLPPSPTAGLVSVNGQTVPFCIGCSAQSPEQSIEPQAAPGTVPAQPKSRVYWFLQR